MSSMSVREGVSIKVPLIIKLCLTVAKSDDKSLIEPLDLVIRLKVDDGCCQASLP